jgi:MoaA/NifB/PqqE/SkfB family radical SAM enzyme
MDLTNIKEIHIEPTSLCNAECLQCARNILGEGLNPAIQLGSLDIEFFENAFNKDNIKNIDKIFFCGNVGDPCATPDLLKILQYLKILKKDIVLGLNTNASLKRPEWFAQLGKILSGPLDYVVFSIDGLEDTNHIYRKNTNFKKIMANAQAYIATGASAHWDMLVFEHNHHQVEECKERARAMGFGWFRSKATDRWDIYPQAVIKPAEEYVKPDYTDVAVDCEKNRDHSIFIDYTGQVWPCCHMAEAHLNLIGRELHKDILEYSNDELMTEYQNKLSNQPFYICRRACGQQTSKRSQWKQQIQLS